MEVSTIFSIKIIHLTIALKSNVLQPRNMLTINKSYRHSLAFH